MSQLSGNEPAAAAPAAAPAPAPAAAAPQAREDQMIVDRAAFDAFGGDAHEAVRLAKQLKQAETDVGMDFTHFMEMVLASDPAEPGTPAEPQTPTDAPAGEQPAGLTPESLNEILNMRDQARAEQDAEAREQYDTAALEQRVQHDKGQAVLSALEAIGCKPNENDEWPPHALKLQRLFEASLADQLLAGIPDWAVNDAGAVDEYLYRTSPTKAQTAKAMEDFKSFFGDVGNTAIASFAQGQSGTPGATVGAGAGGGAPKKQWHDMSHAERVRAVSDPRDVTD